MALPLLGGRRARTFPARVRALLTSSVPVCSRVLSALFLPSVSLGFRLITALRQLSAISASPSAPRGLSRGDDQAGVLPHPAEQGPPQGCAPAGQTWDFALVCLHMGARMSCP